jgi:hypothetical protein
MSNDLTGKVMKSKLVGKNNSRPDYSLQTQKKHHSKPRKESRQAERVIRQGSDLRDQMRSQISF